MDYNLIYMPTFRLRQEEIKVLQTTNFGDKIYPLIEIVKEKDRTNNKKDFQEIHNSIIDRINSNHVFVDIPNYINHAKNVKDEVIQFGLKVSNNENLRNQYILKLTDKHKVIPVISSFANINGNRNSIIEQNNFLKPYFKKFAYRIFVENFENDIIEIEKTITENDYLIVDIDKQTPFKTFTLKPIIETLKKINTPTKVLLRSSINMDVQNVDFNNNEIIENIDHSHLSTENLRDFGVNCFGDYAGVKKDLMTKGGAISPGFIYFDAVKNQSYGFNSSIKSLDQFKNKIVPDVLNSEATERMLHFIPSYLSENNIGYKTLNNIMSGSEKGGSQAKFKKIAMDHYIYCMKNKIQIEELTQVNI